ncbi:MAG: hypothetical protein HFH62_11195 [Lachnospiraceae bacterium]|nr:hypothetical protein [Lachnospiraceae bacterium]
MGGKGSGNKMAYKNARGAKSPVIGDNGLSVKPGEMANIVRHCVTTGMLWPEIDTKDPEQLQQRAMEYFNYCIENDIKPGNLGLYATWGIDRRVLYDQMRREPNSFRTVTIKKSLDILSAIREQLAANGKLNPVTAIFWQKNFDGLKDQQEVILEPKKQIEAEQTPEEVQRMLEQDIPIDVESE